MQAGGGAHACVVDLTPCDPGQLVLTWGCAEAAMAVAARPICAAARAHHAQRQPLHILICCLEAAAESSPTPVWRGEIAACKGAM
eukprot:355876-Chlamydomonas_euryale.AAC.5